MNDTPHDTDEIPRSWGTTEEPAFFHRTNVETFIKHLHADFAEGRITDCLVFFAVPCTIVDFDRCKVEILRHNLALRDYLTTYYQAFLATGVARRQIDVSQIEPPSRGQTCVTVALEEFDADGVRVAKSKIRYHLSQASGPYLTPGTFLIELVELVVSHPQLADLSSGP